MKEIQENTDGGTSKHSVNQLLVFSVTLYFPNNLSLFISLQSTFVMGLLWMKVLGFLKIVNKQFATFILSMIRIIASIRYFGVVLLIVLLMFGDS